MSHLVADDILDVLFEIRRRFDLNGSVADIVELRRDVVRHIAKRELEARRFKNYVSARNSIEDGCSRRLGGFEIAVFDRLVEEWLRGQPDALRAAVLADAATDSQRQRITELLGAVDYQPRTPVVHELESPRPERITTTISRVARDTGRSKLVKVIHNYECQICGYALTLPDGSRYAEGHHVQPLGSPHDGPDELGNIMCVCPNHHAACDLGAIRLVMGELRHADGHDIDQRYVDYHNAKMYPGRQRGQVDTSRPET